MSTASSGRAREHRTRDRLAESGEEWRVVPATPRHEVCHDDSNASNNVVDNLRWDTRSANVLDQVRHGTHVQARKTHCPRNHPYDEQNTYRNNQGRRECRACHREAQAARRARRRQEEAA